MPEVSSEKTHVPYKEFGQRIGFISSRVRSRLHGKETVSADDLKVALRDVMDVQAEDHRNNWLELERWSQRYRDQFAPSTPGVPSTASARFQSTQPVTTNHWAGAPDLRPTQTVWSTVWNDEPGTFIQNPANLYCPLIYSGGVPGIYRWTIDYAFTAPAPMLFELSMMDWNHEGDGWELETPEPSLLHGTTNVHEVAGTIQGVTSVPGTFATLVRFGISAAGDYTLSALQEVTLMRLPIPV